MKIQTKIIYNSAVNLTLLSDNYGVLWIGEGYREYGLLPDKLLIGNNSIPQHIYLAV